MCDTTNSCEREVEGAFLEDVSIAAESKYTTSTQRNASNKYDQLMKPISQSGRLFTGYARLATSCRPVSSGVNLGKSSRASRGMTTSTSRPMTTVGRELRLRTAGEFHTGSSMDAVKLLTGAAIIFFEYMIYVEYDISKALEICSAACQLKSNDWYWKSRLGRCYFKLGLLHDAEKQFRASLEIFPTVDTYLELSNVYLRLDMPNSAMDLLMEASREFTSDPSIVLGIARLCDQLNDLEVAMKMYRRVLSLDASNVEALASLGARYFYSDQPELSIRYYRRLLQMGIQTSELWNNLGLGCFCSAQYDLALNCLDHALSLADDDNMADIWYNIGHIGVALGDLGLAYQGFKVAVAVNPNHGEALNNIAALEMRRMKFKLARNCLNNSFVEDAQLFEPIFNSALMAYRAGEFSEAYSHVIRALKLSPNHSESKEMLATLQSLFAFER